MPDPADVPIRRPAAPKPGRADGDPDPLTPEESAEVVGEIFRDVYRVLGRIEGKVDVVAAQRTGQQAAAADQERTAQHGIAASQAVSEARWRAVQAMVTDPVVRTALVGMTAAVVSVAIALVWYLVTGETRPPIPGVSP